MRPASVERAAHREAARRQLDEDHAGPGVGGRRNRRPDILVRVHVEAAEPAVAGDRVHAVAAGKRVLLAHFERHGDARFLLGLERRRDDGAHRGLLDLQLGLEHAAGRDVDPEAAVRRKIAARFAANHGRRSHFLVLDDGDAGAEAPVFLSQGEAESRLVALLEDAQRQHGIAERAAHVPEVVARALFANVLGLDHRVARRGQEQLGKALLLDRGP